MRAPTPSPPGASVRGMALFPPFPFPDPTSPLPLRARVAVHWEANLRMLRRRRAVTGFLLISLLPMPVLLASVWMMGDGAIGVFGPGGNASFGTVAALATGLLLLLAYGWIQHLAFVEAMRRHYMPDVVACMRARGVEICTACLHQLGPTRPRTCPECGADCAESR